MRTSRAIRAAACSTVLAVLVWGTAACSSGEDQAVEPAETQSPATAEPDPNEPMDGVSANDHDHDHAHDDHALVVPGAGSDPAEAAERVLATWARPELDYATWWAELEPLMSTAGKQAYSETDPAVVPQLKVRPVGVRVLEETPIWARVAVPTDLGRFEVEMSRSAVSAEADGGWQAARIYFPPTAD